VKFCIIVMPLEATQTFYILQSVVPTWLMPKLVRWNDDHCIAICKFPSELIVLLSVSGIKECWCWHLPAAVWTIRPIHLSVSLFRRSADRTAIYQWPYELSMLPSISSFRKYLISHPSEVGKEHLWNCVFSAEYTISFLFTFCIYIFSFLFSFSISFLFTFPCFCLSFTVFCLLAPVFFLTLFFLALCISFVL
jgi:hypothetical protein